MTKVTIYNSNQNVRLEVHFVSLPIKLILTKHLIKLNRYLSVLLLKMGFDAKWVGGWECVELVDLVFWLMMKVLAQFFHE